MPETGRDTDCLVDTSLDMLRERGEDTNLSRRYYTIHYIRYIVTVCFYI